MDTDGPKETKEMQETEKSSTSKLWTCIYMCIYNTRPCSVLSAAVQNCPSEFGLLAHRPSGVQELTHTPSIAFRHLPPNSARFGYGATEGALFISAQLSSDAVSALRKVWVISLWRQLRLQALVYNILPSTTAAFSYAIGSRKLSANEQCFLLLLVLNQ